MGCTPASALTGITYDCDVPTGGLKRLFVAYKNGDGSTSYGFDDGVRAAIEGDGVFAGGQLGLGTQNPDNYKIPTGLSAIGTGTANVFFEIEFNRKDGFSNFTDVVTVNADGSKEVVPSIQVEIPKMDFSKSAELYNMTQGNVELIAAVETAAGTYHLVGVDFGLYAGTLDGASGNSRTEKNRWQLTLTGSEAEAAVNIEAADSFNTIVAAVLPV